MSDVGRSGRQCLAVIPAASKALLMTRTDYHRRAKALAVKVIKLCDEMPRTVGAQTLARQLARSGTSIVSNHRAAYRGRSKAEWLAKMGIVEEESDETILWLGLLVETGYCTEAQVGDLIKETEELLAITVSMIKTGRQRMKMHAPHSEVPPQTSEN